MYVRVGVLRTRGQMSGFDNDRTGSAMNNKIDGRAKRTDTNTKIYTRGKEDKNQGCHDQYVRFPTRARIEKNKHLVLHTRTHPRTRYSLNLSLHHDDPYRYSLPRTHLPLRPCILDKHQISSCRIPASLFLWLSLVECASRIASR